MPPGTPELAASTQVIQGPQPAENEYGAQAKYFGPPHTGGCGPTVATGTELLVLASKYSPTADRRAARAGRLPSGGPVPLGTRKLEFARKRFPGVRPHRVEMSSSGVPGGTSSPPVYSERQRN